MKCRFDPRPIVCKSTDDLSNEASCLTPRQAMSVRALLGPARTSKGKDIFPGYAPGSELGWGLLLGGPDPYSVPLDQYRYIVFSDPNWDWRTFELERDLAAAEKAGAGTLSAVSPDLSAFAKRGGKLLMYHGWTRPGRPSAGEHQLLQRRPAQERTGRRPSVHGARDEPLCRRRGAEHVRRAGSRSSSGSSDRKPRLESWRRTAQMEKSIGRGRSARILRRRTTGEAGDINDAENFVCAK